MKTVNLSRLREFALKEMPRLQIVGQLIIEEPDTIPAEEFVVNVKMWLRLLRKGYSTR